MLALRRREEEAVVLRIGGLEVYIRVYDCHHGSVRLAFEAPQEVKFYRAEIDPHRQELVKP
jgi:carbon storage regulator CsrA